MCVWTLSHGIIVLVGITLSAIVLLHLWPPQISRLFRWFFWGCGLEPADEKAQHDIQGLVGLLAIILGGTVALGAGIQQTGRVNNSYAFFYFLAGLIPLGGMLHIVHQSNLDFYETAKRVFCGQANGLRHIHDGTSVSFATYVWVVSFLLMAFSIGLVSLELFPGQARYNRPLYPSELKLVKPSDGEKPRYYVSVPISKLIYERGIPANLTPNVRLIGTTLANWDVYYCRVRDMSKGGATVVESVPYAAPNAPGFYGIILPPLPPDDNLNLDIYLKQRNSNADKDTAETLRDEVLSRGNLQVIDRPLP